jgi:signal transduction histidine kinase/ligand-binding sensor domain-containing protein
MPIRLRFKLLVILLLVWHSSQAQFSAFADQIFFKQFSTKDGLSQASVNCILHDSKGFMWFGTDDGLNRFDGTQFKVFRNVPGDSSSLMGNNVASILEDENGAIWIGTSEGLCRFDRHQEKFTWFVFKGFEYYTCSDLRMDKQRKRLWISGGLIGICYLDLSTEKLHQYSPAGMPEINATKIEKIESSLYVGTMEHGLFAIDLEHELIERINLSASEMNNPLRKPIRSLLADKNALWVGTEGDGLYKIETGAITRSVRREDKLLSDNKVWSIAIGPDQRLWIGTDGGGLTILNPELTKATHYTHSDYNNHTIGSNTIRAILTDQNNDVWLGTFNGGVSYYSSFNINFLSFRKDPLNPNSLSHNAVLSFCEGNDGTLYVGTDGGGLNYLRDGKFYKYNFPQQVDEPNVILTIRKTSAGGLLIGTYQDGLYHIGIDRSVRQYKNNTADSTTISSNIIWDIAEDETGNIWLATELGVNMLDKKTGKFIHYKNRRPEDSQEVFTNDYIQSLLIDSTQTLWGGLYGMLLVNDLRNHSVKKYLTSGGTEVGVPNKQILSIRADPLHAGSVWFSGRGDGLVHVDPVANKIDIIEEKDGLPNGLIYALECDDKGSLWLTTNKGLVRYNPSTKEFFTFDESFGLDIVPFIDNAAYKTRDGYILFGGANGFTAFLPAEIDLSKRELEVTFTGFQLFNEEVKIDNAILKRSITEAAEIELPHDKARFISFDFSALQFLASSSIHYQYMLEGFDTAWHEADNRTVSFINLLPRDYKLHVKAGYGPGFWGDERVLTIRVIPGWWMTWYARAGALLLLLCMAYVFFRYRTYKLKIRKVELEKIVAEQNREIRHKNMELEAQNEELTQHNEELLTQRETISVQNSMLNEAQQQLQEINQSLEFLVQQRTEKLNDTIGRLNKTIKELDAFLYSASHDLVSPLKSVLGLVNLARQENTNQALVSYFDHIETTVRKLEGVIHTLMQHSYNAKAVSQKQRADLGALVRETITELQFMPEARRVKFNLSVNDAFVLTDIPRMKIILSNLVGNAIKYHDPYKEINAVHIQFSRDLDGWKLVLQDNGIGIEESRINRIFDMFYRATESAKGSGLGLYIVKETVERLAGEIKVESEYGQWTRFTLRFPVTESAEV